MAKVDPFVIPIPKALQTDPSVRFYHEYLNKFLHDLWIRTGGGGDEIANQQLRELYPWQALVDDEPERVFGLYNGNDKAQDDGIQSNPYSAGHAQDKTEIIAVSADYTTTGNEIIICTNTVAITVTLNAEPDDGEQVHIKRQNTGSVTIVGDIDGQTSITPVLRYDSPHLVYTVAADQWSII